MTPKSLLFQNISIQSFETYKTFEQGKVFDKHAFLQAACEIH